MSVRPARRRRPVLAALSIALVCVLFGGYALFLVADARRARTFGLIRDVRPRVTRMLIPAGIGAVIAIYVSSSDAFGATYGALTGIMVGAAIDRQPPDEDPTAGLDT